MDEIRAGDSPEGLVQIVIEQHRVDEGAASTRVELGRTHLAQQLEELRDRHDEFGTFAEVPVLEDANEFVADIVARFLQTGNEELNYLFYHKTVSPSRNHAPMSFSINCFISMDTS